jgi:hypothetical protein
MHQWTLLKKSISILKKIASIHFRRKMFMEAILRTCNNIIMIDMNIKLLATRSLVQQ